MGAPRLVAGDRRLGYSASLHAPLRSAWLLVLDSFPYIYPMDRYQTTKETYDAVAGAYQDKFMDLDLYNDTYDTFCRLVKKTGARIFEIGCGPGNITRYLLKQRPDFVLEAIDVAPNMIRLAQANNPTARFTVMDCREIDMLTHTFDGIICGFCMPYLSKEDVAKMMQDCAFLLNPGGIFYFSAIEGDYARSGFEAGSTGHKTYVYYHETEWLLEQLRESGFSLIELIRKQYPKNNGGQQVHTIFIASK